jgi:hypothetical protein
MHTTVSCCFIGFLMAPERKREKTERQRVRERERERSEQAGESERRICELIHGSGASSET